jgi:hypothetical protein
MLLMPEPALKRSQLLVLAAMSVTAAAIHLMFGPAAVIGFGGSALIFHLLQTGWHRAPGAAGSS